MKNKSFELMEPGTLWEVRAPCTFEAGNPKRPGEVEFLGVDKGTILMSLGFEVLPDAADTVTTFKFRFLYGEKEIYLPVRLLVDLKSTEERIKLAHEMPLCFVKPAKQ